MARSLSKYRTLLVLPVVLACLSSCTKLSRNNESQTGSITQKDMVRFASGVRPVKGSADSLYLLGTYYQKRGLFKNAVAEFRKVLEVDPGYIKAYEGLGLAFAQAGDFSKSAEAYRNAVKLNPKLGFLHNNLGYSLIRLQKYTEAIGALKEAENLDRNNKRIHNNLGLAYALSGRYDPALVEFEKAEEKSKAHCTLGSLLFRAGRPEEAGNHYRIALELDPSLSEARKGLKDCGQFSKNVEAQDLTVQAGTLQNVASVALEGTAPKCQDGFSAKRRTVILPELQLAAILSKVAEKGYLEAGSVEDLKCRQG